MNHKTKPVSMPQGSLALIGILIIYLLPMILMMMTFIFINLLNPGIYFSSLFIYTIYSINCWITFLIMLKLLWKQGLNLRKIGYKGKINLLNIGISLLFFIAGLIILTISAIVLDYLGMYWSSTLELFTITNVLDIIIVVFTLIITAPIIEDTFYRAYSITILRTRLKNPWIAGILSCSIFALIYMPFWGIRGAIHLFLWALLSMTLFIWRKSIYPCLIMHVANNSFMYIFIPLLG